MKITQVKDLVNNTLKQMDGTSELLKDDLSNTVDVGNEIINTENVDNYVKKLVDRIGSVVMNNRVYQGSVPSILMTSWEFGSVLEKIDMDLPQAQETDDWNLNNGQSYDPNIFYQPKVTAQFFNSKVTFTIPISFTNRQVTESFASATDLNSFLSMIQGKVTSSMNISISNLVKKTINNMTANVLTSGTPMQKVNLLAEYNKQTGSKLTTANALTTPDFIKFANLVINTTQNRLAEISTLFNTGKKERFTPLDEQHLVLLSDLASASKVYLEATTVNEDNVKVANSYDTVPFWQGSGTNYDFADTSAIDVAIKSNSTTQEVKQGGILAVLFDQQSVGVACSNQRTTTNTNARAEFYTNFNKYDAGYFNDLNENYVVFYLQDSQHA